MGLAAVCQRVMEHKLCKKEQMSNWENRPLRYSQEHYGAMDAWVLGEIMVKLLKNGKHKLEKQITPIGLNMPKGSKEEKKEAKADKPKEERQPMKADPAKIKYYERQIEHHQKKGR